MSTTHGGTLRRPATSIAPRVCGEIGVTRVALIGVSGERPITEAEERDGAYRGAERPRQILAGSEGIEPPTRGLGVP